MRTYGGSTEAELESASVGVRATSWRNNSGCGSDSGSGCSRYTRARARARRRRRSSSSSSNRFIEHRRLPLLKSVGQQWTVATSPSMSIGDDTRNHKFGSATGGGQLATTVTLLIELQQKQKLELELKPKPDDDEPQQQTSLRCNRMTLAPAMVGSAKAGRSCQSVMANELVADFATQDQDQDREGDKEEACRQREVPLPLFSPLPLVATTGKKEETTMVDSAKLERITITDLNLNQHKLVSPVSRSSSSGVEPGATQQQQPQIRATTEVNRKKRQIHIKTKTKLNPTATSVGGEMMMIKRYRSNVKEDRTKSSEEIVMKCDLSTKATFIHGSCRPSDNEQIQSRDNQHEEFIIKSKRRAHNPRHSFNENEKIPVPKQHLCSPCQSSEKVITNSPAVKCAPHPKSLKVVNIPFLESNEQPIRMLTKGRKRPLNARQEQHICSFSVSRFFRSKSSRGIVLTVLQLVELVFIYSLITSNTQIFVPVSATNYWPQIKASLTPSRQLTSIRHHHAATSGGGSMSGDTGQSARVGGPLLIGQHYNNFSSIIPYSIVQDSDYGNPMPEDQTMDEELVQQQQQQQHLEHQQQNLIKQQQQQQPHDMTVKQQVEMTRSDSTLLELGDAFTATAAAAVSSANDDEGKQLTSRALLQSLASQLDSNRLMLPQMQQIKSRFNQGCVGGTKCQFFAFCWMSGGSLGASCGLLMTCCVTPSRQEIQPGFYGPVVNDPYCGRSTSKINRIVGGTDASFGQFPWQAFVQVGGSRCGGALISSRHVVTAGHCVARSQHTPSSIKVTLGDYILNSDIESIPHEVFSVVEVLLHPNFRFTPQADRYDVAVLELDRTASYKDNIKPICLPQKDAAFVGRVAYVAGWGALQAGSKLRPKVLQHVAVPVIENQVCESWHRRKGIDIRIYDEMMCAGYEMGQRDACQGDSGGPLMLNQFGVWYLVGIVSAGYSCAKQYQPGIYHRVSSSSDWISSNIYQQGANN